MGKRSILMINVFFFGQPAKTKKPGQKRKGIFFGNEDYFREDLMISSWRQVPFLDLFSFWGYVNAILLLLLKSTPGGLKNSTSWSVGSCFFFSCYKNMEVRDREIFSDIQVIISG